MCQLLKLRLGASRTRAVGWLVGRLVGRSAKGRLQNSKPGKTWENIPTSPDPTLGLEIFEGWEWN